MALCFSCSTNRSSLNLAKKGVLEVDKDLVVDEPPQPALVTGLRRQTIISA